MSAKNAPLPAMQQKLKDARAEIEAVLKKHDIAGFASLHAPGFGEVFWTMWPSYSILVGDFPLVRIKSKLADYGGDADRQRADQANSAAMVEHLGSSLAQCGIQFLELSDVLNAKLGAETSLQGFQPEPSKLNPGSH
ncbi:hypothetical protein [Limnobacter sp.]|uniref:hypothetical protein n=1 Tax=Limnobacter sp. TaxID=2003368 RepID=UPI002733EF35|nr:hypothetical protein [Limnobacter sp.]MDP3272466.1 hypothetical protein [Limnobacter sp.]